MLLSCYCVSAYLLRASINTHITLRLPVVRVPVLSKTTSVTPRAVSSVWGSLKMMPERAATPLAISTTIGTAKPIAQGHETTKVAIAYVKAVMAAELVS